MHPDQFVRLPEVKRLSGLTRSTIYRHIAKGMFPRQCRVGGVAAWSQDEITKWQRAQLAHRDTAGSGSERERNRRGAGRAGFSAGALIDPA